MATKRFVRGLALCLSVMAFESSAALADTDVAEAALLRLPLPPVIRAARPGVISAVAGGRRMYLRAVQRAAEVYGVPPQVADAVVQVESAYEPSAIGSVGEIGLMQVMPSTAAMLGFKGSIAELAKPDVNIQYGVTYLAKAWRLAGGIFVVHL